MYCSFRPLSGNYISQWFGRLTVLCEDGRFPSPVGELHFSIGSKELLRNHDGSFRPLSGNYISQSPFDNALNALFLVSVPCRGTTFLNCADCDYENSGRTEFPSPVGELHFSIRTDKNRYTASIIVSVPCRGTTFLNTIPTIPPPVWAHGRDCVGKIFLEK